MKIPKLRKTNSNFLKGLNCHKGLLFFLFFHYSISKSSAIMLGNTPCASVIELSQKLAVMNSYQLQNHWEKNKGLNSPEKVSSDNFPNNQKVCENYLLFAG